MGDKILSQSEIEALLAAMGGEAEAPVPAVPEPVEPDRPVTVYDFRRPNKFSKDHLRALRILNETFARRLGSALTSYLRNAVQLRLTVVDQVSYDKYIRSLPTPTVLYVVAMAPLPGQAVIEVNLPVVLAIVDRLLGGSGVVRQRPRDLTEIELALMKTLGGVISGSLADAWRNVIPLQPQLQEPVLTPEFVQVASPSEVTVMLMFEISALGVGGTLSMCIPHAAIEPILDQLISHMWAGSVRASETGDHRLRLNEHLAPVVLPVSVEIGAAGMTLRELLELPEGQVVKLDTPATGNLRVRVGGRLKFLGRPGVKGRNLAVQITRIVSKEASDMTGELRSPNEPDPDLFADVAAGNGDLAGGAGVNPAEFGALSGAAPSGAGPGIDLLMDVNLQVSVELGRTRMTIGELLALRAGSVIELDKLAGEPADILVNGTRIARGEVVVVDEKFGVRVLDIVTRAKRLASMG